jgi:hypothetical protein
MPRLVHRAPRTNRLLLSFTGEELSLLRDRARAAHIPLARYIREVALGYAPRPKQHAVNAEAVRALADVGNVLRALAAAVRASGATSIEARLDEAIRRVLSVIGALR